MSSNPLLEEEYRTAVVNFDQERDHEEDGPKHGHSQ
jgi:hypothetical protein